MTELPDLKRFLTPAQAAEAAGVHIGTIRRWLADGRLTAYRVGPRFLKIDPAELDRLVEPYTGSI